MVVVGLLVLLNPSVVSFPLFPDGGEARVLHDPIESIVESPDLSLKRVGILGLFLLVKVDMALLGVFSVLLEKPFHRGLVASFLIGQSAGVIGDSGRRSYARRIRCGATLPSMTPTRWAEFAKSRAVTAGNRSASWTELDTAEGGHVITKDGLVELNAERRHDGFGGAIVFPAVGKVLVDSRDSQGWFTTLTNQVRTLKLRTFPGTLRVRNCSGGLGREAMTALLMSREILAMPSSSSLRCSSSFSFPAIGMLRAIVNGVRRARPGLGGSTRNSLSGPVCLYTSPRISRNISCGPRLKVNTPTNPRLQRVFLAQVVGVLVRSTNNVRSKPQLDKLRIDLYY